LCLVFQVVSSLQIFWSKFCMPFSSLLGNHGSSVSIVTRLWGGWPGFDYQQRLEIFLFPTMSRPGLGPT
jgi:hypothetical protein